jgi:hypothetical protein
MPIKNFQKFESVFYKNDEFNKKIYEEYWGNEYRNDDDDDEWCSEPFDKTENPKKSLMMSIIDLGKLHFVGLSDYRDIAENCIIYFEKQIATGSYGETVVPSIDIVRDYIMTTIGLDYKKYISENQLDDLSKFIYQEIDNYIFD